MRWCWIASSRRFRRATNAYETINSSTIVTSGGPARYINERIMATNQLTFEAWVKAANVTQIGPARIITLSDAPVQVSAGARTGAKRLQSGGSPGTECVVL